jgi:hypothetical protein
MTSRTVLRAATAAAQGGELRRLDPVELSQIDEIQAEADAETMENGRLQTPMAGSRWGVGTSLRRLITANPNAEGAMARNAKFLTLAIAALLIAVSPIC